MTNQEAIEILKIERNHMIPTLLPERIEAMDMAISSLQAQETINRRNKSVQNVNIDDFVTRKEVKELSKNSTELDKENGELQPNLQPTCNNLATDTISRQASCDYCHEDSDGYVTPLEKNCHAFIRFGMDGWELDLHAKGWHGSAKIMYCPMCGRELKHE